MDLPPAAPGVRVSTRDRPPPAARRFGYLVAIGVNVVLLLLVHGDPGWRALPFLTEQTTLVLPWVTAQLGTAIAVNLVWLLADPRWLRALGEVLTAATGLVATLRVLEVFPFDLDGSGWVTVVRVVLWVGVVGSAIGVVANLVRFVRALLADGGSAAV